MRNLWSFLIGVALLFSAFSVNAQEATEVATDSGCVVTPSEVGYPVITGNCTSEELSQSALILLNQLGIDTSVSPSVPLPILKVESESRTVTYYPHADDFLFAIITGMPELDPDIWQVPFNVDMNGYSSHNGYTTDGGKPLKCGSSDNGCQVEISGQGYFSISGDNQIPKLGYQCSMDGGGSDPESISVGCAVSVINLSVTEQTVLTVGSTEAYSWQGTYFNGGNLVDGSEPPQVIEPPISALSVMPWALTSNIVYGLLSNPGNCAKTQGCDGVDSTIFFVTGPTILARVDQLYYK